MLVVPAWTPPFVPSEVAGTLDFSPRPRRVHHRSRIVIRPRALRRLRRSRREVSQSLVVAAFEQTHLSLGSGVASMVVGELPLWSIL